MGIWIILGLIFFLPLVMFIAWMALSSCLGDSLRATIAGASMNPRQASFGRSYARGLGSGTGQAGWEQIEMEEMLDHVEDSDGEP
ncbi:glutamine amidotransferase type 1 [Diplodia corticola]|uniref:Glutamine amidotransferase type 1 n=1 Tax=Diplodia corticola TaxID=236234 RepID=A0A1J9S6V6_9PEZI|nr:glutamine amidotransferase type 1 [Diplodia corticola]OJD40683.1 glutamine amidotransferase type 1 [Diplodia corticola]